MLTACDAEPAPDFIGSADVAHGNRSVSLKLDAWHQDEGKPCQVVIRGSGVDNWVKPDGVLPRMTLAPAVIHACKGRTPYLSSVSGGVGGAAAEWEESSGPESAVAISAYRVRVLSLNAEQARVEVLSSSTR